MTFFLTHEEVAEFNTKNKIEKIELQLNRVQHLLLEPKNNGCC